MLLIRRFDERLLALKKQGLVPGHTALTSGRKPSPPGSRPSLPPETSLRVTIVRPGMP